MKPRTIQYFRLQCRRTLRQLPAALLVTVLLLASAALLGSALLEKNRSDTPVTRIPVGLVGDFENEYLSFGLFAVENLDPSRFSVEFQVLESERAARAALMRGDISAYLVIPDTFVESISAGKLEPLRYVSTGGAASLGSALTDELVAAVSEMVTATEDAIYGAQDFVADRMPRMKPWKAGEALGRQFTDLVLERSAMFDTEIIPTPAGMDLAQSLLCGVLVLFLLLWGITATGVFARREPELSGMLYARGMGAARQVSAELGAYLALLLLTLALVAACALPVLKSAPLASLGLQIDATALAGLLWRLLVAAVMIGTLQFLLYEIASGVIQSVLLQFLTAMALGYVSGCLYPLRFFPEAMQAAAQWLPAGCAISFLGAGLTHRGAPGAAIAIAAYTALFFAAAVALRHRRLLRSGL